MNRRDLPLFWVCFDGWWPWGDEIEMDPKTKMFLASIFFVGYVPFVFNVDIPCFYQKTGIYCPGCGATRAVKALLIGDLSLAAHQNLWLVLFVFPLIILLGFKKSFSTLKKSAKFDHIFNKFAIFVGFAGMIYFGLRNVPIKQFDFLRPI